MEGRTLGNTGLAVSALGFGCGSIGGLLVRGEAAEQRAAVAAALESGVTYFDTAPSYGDGRSEETLGRVLRELGETPLVGTKFQLRADESDFAGAIERSLQSSLRRLGRDSVDLFQLHTRVGADLGAGMLPADTVIGPVAAALEALKTAGRVRAFGFTGLGEPASLARVAESGRFDTMQAYVNVINPSAAHVGTASANEVDFGGLIGRAAGAGLGVLAIRVLAAGAVAGASRHPIAGSTGQPLAGGGAAYEDDVRRASRLAALSTELGLEGTVELALRFAIGIPGVSTALVGFSDAAQVRDALRFAAHGSLPADAVRLVLTDAEA